MKNFKKIYENVGNLGILNREYIVKAQNSNQIFLDEENCVMKDQIHIVNQFKKKSKKFFV